MNSVLTAKKRVPEIESHAKTRNYVFFYEAEERLTGVNWLSRELNSPIAVVFLSEESVWNEFSSKA
jgi:hypothetical protein